jgi:hypothetical protein
LVAALEAIEAYAIEALRYEASDVDDPKIAKRVAAYQALRKQHGAGWVPRFFICALLFVGAVTGCSDHAKSVTGPAVDCSVESTRRENPVVCQPPAQPE